jgi:hypothetical protein
LVAENLAGAEGEDLKRASAAIPSYVEAVTFLSGRFAGAFSRRELERQLEALDLPIQSKASSVSKEVETEIGKYAQKRVELLMSVFLVRLRAVPDVASPDRFKRALIATRVELLKSASPARGPARRRS